MATAHISSLSSAAQEGVESRLALQAELGFAERNSRMSNMAGKMEFFRFNFWSLSNSIAFFKDTFRKPSWKRAFSDLKNKTLFSFLSPQDKNKDKNESPSGCFQVILSQ